MGSPTLIILPILAILTTTSSAVCTRPILQQTLDTFFSSAGGTSNASSIVLSTDVKIAQNGIPATSLAETAHANITGFAKPFRITVLDESACNVASMVVVKMGSSPDPVLTSVRLQIADGDGLAVQEVEILNPAGTINLPSQIPDSPGEIWARPLEGDQTKDELVAILDTYPSGIQAADGSGVRTAEDCGRIENGMRMPFRCNEAFQGLGFNVTNRDFYVDTKTGVSLAKFLFDRQRNPLWLHEYMKITNGEIREIYAVMMVPHGPERFVDLFSEEI